MLTHERWTTKKISRSFANSIFGLVWYLHAIFPFTSSKTLNALFRRCTSHYNSFYSFLTQRQRSSNDKLSCDSLFASSSLLLLTTFFYGWQGTQIWLFAMLSSLLLTLDILGPTEGIAMATDSAVIVYSSTLRYSWHTLDSFPLSSRNARTLSCNHLFCSSLHAL